MWFIDKIVLSGSMNVPCIFYDNQLSVDFPGTTISLRCSDSGEIKVLTLTKGLKYVVDETLHDLMPYGFVPLHRFKITGADMSVSMSGALICVDSHSFELLELVDRIEPIPGPPQIVYSKRNVAKYGVRVLDIERSLFDFEFEYRWSRKPDFNDKLIMAFPLLYVMLSCPDGWCYDRYYFRASEAIDELSIKGEVPDAKWFRVSFCDVEKARTFISKMTVLRGTDYLMSGMKQMKRIYKSIYRVSL